MKLFLVVSSVFLLISPHFSGAEKSIDDGVCEGMALTKDPKELERLRNCRIIDGSLSLARIEYPRHPENAYFPELLEIRGFLRIHKTDNLLSVSELFPSLAVIRGEKLSEESFALDITENRDLKEIGLESLRLIVKGRIRVSNNTKLCFADTIDWKIIASDQTHGEHMFKANNAHCPSCKKSAYCWNLEKPQMTCDSSCLSGFCSNNKNCCDPECLGGCDESDPKDCKACKNFSFNGTCVERCPEDTFKYRNSFCITRDECNRENVLKPGRKYIPYDETCRSKCPEGLTLLGLDESNNTFTCVDQRNLKICESVTVKNDEIHFNYKDCDIINGFVDIQLTQSDICSEENRKFYELFSKSFMRTKEIRHYLRITNTSMIKDLGLFRNLERIRGIQLHDRKYSLVLQHNENLQNRWPNNQNVLIDRGEKSIKSNAKTQINDDSVIDVVADPKTYAVTINWTLPEWVNKSQPQKYMYSYDEEEDYSPFFICRRTPWEFINGSIENVLNIYQLEPNDKKYVFHLNLVDSNNEPIASSETLKFSTKKLCFQGVEQLIKPHETRLRWNAPVTSPPNGFELAYYDLKAFHNGYDLNFYNSFDNCINPDFNETVRTRTLTDLKDSDKANIKSMKPNIREMFQKEMLNEPFEAENITREYIHVTVDLKEARISLEDLEFYAYYHISIRACYKNAESNVTCSDPVIPLVQTDHVYDADRVENVTAVSNEPTEIEVEWNNPSRINGVILSYKIEYHLVGYSKSIKCVTFSEFKANRKQKIQGLVAGNYSVAVAIVTLSRKIASLSVPVFVQVSKNIDLTPYLTFGTLALALFILVVFLYKLSKKEKIHLLKAMNNLHYHPFIRKPDDEFELKRENIQLIKVLGSGNFGQVHEGELKMTDGENETFTSVAVKMINSESSFNEFHNLLKEADIMKSFNTFHIIKLLGVVTQCRPYYVVMELMANGDLKSFLMHNRPQNRIDNYMQIPMVQPIPPVTQMALQIADGMAYLQEKRFVHRDLAARNCMVSEDRTVKIGDFGLTRDIYETDYYLQGSQSFLPVRWMAPESLNYGMYTSESDVFSYGMVLFEIVTYAQKPYRGKSNYEVVNFVGSGGTETRPPLNCSDKIYEIMRKCWKYEPLNRISFNGIINLLIDEAPAKFLEKSFYCLGD